MVALARDHGISTAFVPAVGAAEAALTEAMRIIPVASLAALVAHLRDEPPFPAAQPPMALDLEPAPAVDFAAVRGYKYVKRALEVAAADGHNVLIGASEVGACRTRAGWAALLPPRGR